MDANPLSRNWLQRGGSCRLVNSTPFTQDVSAIRFAFGGGLFQLNVPRFGVSSYRMAGVGLRALLITVAIATSIALVAVGSDGL